MAKNGNGKEREKNSRKAEAPAIKLKAETKHGILAIIFFVLALALFMSAFGLAGRAGNFIYKVFYYLLGIGYYLLPSLFILLGISFVRKEAPDFGFMRILSAILFLGAGLGIIDIASVTPSLWGGGRGAGGGDIS